MDAGYRSLDGQVCGCMLCKAQECPSVWNIVAKRNGSGPVGTKGRSNWRWGPLLPCWGGMIAVVNAFER